jgi:GDP-L-fucose synthase
MERIQQCETVRPNEKPLVLVTGGSGLVGTAIRELSEKNDMGFTWLFTNSSLLNLLSDYSTVRAFFDTHRPKYVIHLAAKVCHLLL